MLRWRHLPYEQWFQGINRVANMHFKGPAHPCYRCFPLLWLIGLLLRALRSCKTALARHLSDSVRFGAPVRMGQITAHVILSLVAWALNLRRCPISLVNWEQLCGRAVSFRCAHANQIRVRWANLIWFTGHTAPTRSHTKLDVLCGVVQDKKPLAAFQSTL